MSVRVALFWDIDGTLLTTARAGIGSLEDALERVSGIRADLQGVVTAGLTDYAIAKHALRSVGHPADEESVREFLRIHGEQLASYLGRPAGHVMPGVEDALEDLAPREDVANLLLTGNIEDGAWAKLEHYGLARFFPLGGAFCTGPGEREEIAQRALARVNGAERVYVIGDTPHDIAAGKAIGARTLAVATGSFGADELAEHNPWRVVPQIPPPPAFRDLIELR